MHSFVAPLVTSFVQCCLKISVLQTKVNQHPVLELIQVAAESLVVVVLL